MLPTEIGASSAASWRRIESLGFAHAWTYDHITWSGLPEGPWHSAIVTLTAAACATERLRLGTLVSSPNFRHPVPFAQELMSLDLLSEGRLVLGFGAGSFGPDAGVLGRPEWSRGERGKRYEEFVDLLDVLLRGASEGEPRTTYAGTYYAAREARIEPGCAQRPRLPFALAATGPRGMRLVARQAATWVVTDDDERADADPARRFALLRTLSRRLDEACEREGRDPRDLGRLVLGGSGPLGVAAGSPAVFEDAVGELSELGFTDVVLHQPRAGEPYAYRPDLLERIAEVLPRLADTTPLSTAT